MIPIKLQLYNFMSYREPDPLDFSGIHLACLAGEVGAGKSTLLDAITWVLWGKTRSTFETSVRDDELIYGFGGPLAQTEMEVEFEFKLGQNHYRVIRKRDSRGRGRSSLELQIFDGNIFQPLTETAIAKTQARINAILRMDYETAINSAFLLQERADEFTTANPADRRRILGKMFDFFLWDQSEQVAKKHGDAAGKELEQITAQILLYEQELEHKTEYEEQLEQARADAENSVDALREGETDLSKLREERQELVLKQVQIEELSTRLAQGERELAEVNEGITACEELLAEHNAIISKAKNIAEGFAALTAAREIHEALNEKLAQLVGLKDCKSRLEATIAEARHTLDLEVVICSEKAGELSRLAQDEGGLRANLTNVRAQLKQLAKRENERETKQQETAELSNEKASLKTRNEHLWSELDSVKEKRRLLQATESPEGTGVQCPLGLECTQDLSDADRVRLVEEVSSEILKSDALYRASEAKATELATQCRVLEQEIEDIKRELSAKGPAQKREATLEDSLSQAKRATEELPEQREKLEDLDIRLAAEQYAETEHAELAELSAQIEGVDYNPLAHEETRRDLKLLSHFEQDKAKLQAALERIEEDRASLGRLSRSQARWQENLGTDLAKKEALAQELSQLPELVSQLQRTTIQVNELRDKEAHARQVLGQAEQKLHHCTHLAMERVKKLSEREHAAWQKAIYDELRLAFGKKGVQAMIIEIHIPEIEDEANKLLARMTDGRTRVRFDTQRQTRKGKAVETLDIRVSDELGTRSYELYSGGESFQINFAVRVGLSKVLAHRSGATLQTLIVDEGFGTQDAQGRQRIVEGINSISDDFECILVITHIEELKDAFPVRIDVFKTPEGSQAMIS